MLTTSMIPSMRKKGKRTRELTYQRRTRERGLHLIMVVGVPMWKVVANASALRVSLLPFIGCTDTHSILLYFMPESKSRRICEASACVNLCCAALPCFGWTWTTPLGRDGSGAGSGVGAGGGGADFRSAAATSNATARFAEFFSRIFWRCASKCCRLASISASDIAARRDGQEMTRSGPRCVSQQTGYRYGVIQPAVERSQAGGAPRGGRIGTHP
jgi:hypothetical protein